MSGIVRGVALALLCAAAVGELSADEPVVRIVPEEIVSDSIAAADVELSAFGSYIALYDSTEANTVRLFDSSLEVLWRHRLSAYWAGSWDAGSVIQFSPDESWVFFPGYRSDNDIAIVETQTGELVSILTEHDPERAVTAIALSADGRRLVSTTSRELIVWERRGAGYEPIARIDEFEPVTMAIEWLPDGRRFALSARSQQRRMVSVYSVSVDGGIDRTFHYEFTDNNISFDIYQIAISPTGDRIAAGYRDTLIVLDPDSDTPPIEVRGIDIGTVYTLVFAPSGRELVTAHSRYLRVWRLAGDAVDEVATVASQRPVALDIELSADAHYLYLASDADSNALSRYAVEGLTPSELGLVVEALGGELSDAQRVVLSPAAARSVVGGIEESRFAPRDMFETVEEYEARSTGVGAEIRAGVAALVEERFVEDRAMIRPGTFELESSVRQQGRYDIDRGRYTLPAFGTEAWLSIDRDAARDLYRGWDRSRVRVTRVGGETTTSYSDFRLSHPTNGREYPLAFTRNPFTGEALDGAERRIPVIAVGPDLVIRDLRLEGILPTLYRSYAENPLGALTIENVGTGILSNVEISVSIPALGAGPRAVAVPRSIAAGRSIDAVLTLPLGAELLGPAGARTVTIEIEVSYERAGASHHEAIAREMTVLNRNAIQWSDDRRVGAFMTVEDPVIVGWGSGLVGSIDLPATNVLTSDLLSAIQLFEALSLHGVNYVVDPSSAYEELSQNSLAVDYVRFPAETLASRAGDCDDLSVLYATLLESVGVSSAFITTPGHIFTAVGLGIPPERARSYFTDPEQLIFTERETWMPVETTMIGEGFVRAWQSGALQWRRSLAAGDARLIETREAWRAYPPVSGIDVEPGDPPAATAVEVETARRLAELRSLELEPQRVAIVAMRESLSPAETANRLGVLYAEYGLFEEAARHFDEAIHDAGYVPAIVNRANVAALLGRMDEARRYLERASAQEPANARVLLGLAFSYWQAGDRDGARRAYDRVVELRPALADRYPLFGADETTAGGTGRAAAVLADRFYASNWE